MRILTVATAAATAVSTAAAATPEATAAATASATRRHVAAVVAGVHGQAVGRIHLQVARSQLLLLCQHLVGHRLRQVERGTCAPPMGTLVNPGASGGGLPPSLHSTALKADRVLSLNCNAASAGSIRWQLRTQTVL